MSRNTEATDDVKTWTGGAATMSKPGPAAR